MVWEEGDKAYHYVSLVMRAQLDSSFKEEPENPEPEKCEGNTEKKKKLHL